MHFADSVVVFDFETTGLSPNLGDRAIEIGAVKIEQGEVVGQFQQLMNPGRKINSFIADYTGITNSMLAGAPSCGQVMAEFADFIGQSPLVAHNASFDQRFLDAEFSYIGAQHSGLFACSMLVARRLVPDAPNHKLGNLVNYLRIPSDGQFHRALYDAQMTAQLWLRLLHCVNQYQIDPIPFKLMGKIAKTSKAKVADLLAQYGNNSAARA